LRAFVRRLGSVLAKAITVAVHFKGVDVVRQPVEQCSGEALGAEDLGPFIDR